MRYSCRVLLFLSCLGAPQVACGQLIPDSGEMSPSAYLDSVLSIMQTHSLHRARVDWQAVRSGAQRRAGGVDSIADVYAAIRWAIEQLGDHHSRFWTPGRAAEFDEPTEPGSLAWYMAPRGEPIGRAGYLLVPRFTGHEDQIGRYADSLVALTRRQDTGGTCGWIVDLRENTGGSVLPMVGGLRPFLGEGSLLTSKYGDGTYKTWTYEQMVEEAVSRYGFEDPVPAQYMLRDPDAPVAVLTGPLTSSSGEAVALAFRGGAATRSFGYATQGLSTWNDAFELPDGAMLILTVAVMADRGGYDHEGGPIPPEEAVEDERGYRSGYRPAVDGPVIQRALTWLLAQDACQEVQADMQRAPGTGNHP